MLDIVGVLNAQDDYTKNRNYWKYLKNKLKNEGSEVVSVTNQLKLLAPDGKRRLTDVLDYDGVVLLAKSFPNTRAFGTVKGLLGHIGDDQIIINQPFYCDYGKQISVGKSFFANFHFTVLGEAKVTIGDDMIYKKNM